MIRYKEYKDYDEYVKKQGDKITFKLDEIRADCPRRIQQFRKLFTKYKPHLKKGNMLCLGARTGCEITGAILDGFTKSKGIDLHPVGDNVAYGDFHNIPFADSTFQNVFTNSLDHCLSLDKLTEEVKRVLVGEGRFFWMTMHKQCLTEYKGSIENRIASRAYDACFWDTEEELIDYFIGGGFSLVHDDSGNKWGFVILKNQ